MKKTGRCPKCDSTSLVKDAKAVDRGHAGSEAELTVATQRRPDALVFKGTVRSTLSAWVCLGCGYVEYYADDPKALRV